MYLAVAAGGALPFLGGYTRVFLADDWPLIGAARGLSFSNTALWLRPVPGTFYRPLFSLALAAGWRAFGTTTIAYHLTVWAAYVTVGALVGVAAFLLSRDPRVGAVATLLFAVQGIHSEPVLWLAASNEVLAAFWVLVAFCAFLAWRRRCCAPWWLVSLAAYLLALASKETAVFLPLVLVALRPRSAGRISLRPLAPFAVIGGAFAVWRLAAGSPYPVARAVPRIPVNAGYYGAVLALGLPEQYGYRTGLGLWHRAPLLPVVTMGLMAVAWLILVAGRSRLRGDGQRYVATVLIWTVAAVLPVLLTATGRTAFMASIGVAWLGAGLAVRSRRRRTGVLAVGLALAAQVLLIGDRTYWWHRAGVVMEDALAAAAPYVAAGACDTTLCWSGAPDHLRHAYVFRNALPAMAAMVAPGCHWEAAAPGPTPAAATDCDVVLEYTGQEFRAVPAEPAPPGPLGRPRSPASLHGP